MYSLVCCVIDATLCDAKLCLGLGETWAVIHLADAGGAAALAQRQTGGAGVCHDVATDGLVLIGSASKRH